MQITQFTDYGLRCLIYLVSQSDKLSNVKEISNYYNISHNHLVKVVHKLSLLGYIESRKGKGGGIKIAPHTIHLKLGELVKQLEPTMDLVECFNKSQNTCKIINICHLKHSFYKAQKAFIETLNQFTLEDMKLNIHPSKKK